jgi:hypothetical protein
MICIPRTCRKAKLLDDDDDDGMGMATAAPSQIQPATTWHMPTLLPERPDVSPAQLTSVEISVQNTRMATVAPVRYTSEYDVPSNPAPLSDVEQALDMTSQSSKVVSAMPFFVPQVPAPAPAVAPTPAPSHAYGGHGINVPLANSLGFAIASQPQPGSAAASAETVQTLGLPMFLVGQNVQALQTLASTPSLLSTFVDSNGMYDQARLMSLVQTLSQNIAPSQPQLVPMGHVGGMGVYPHGNASAYGPAGGQPQAYASGGGGIYGPASSYGPDPGAPGPGSQRSFGAVGSMKNGYRGDQNNGDGNLHLSGYGAATTQADIVSLFAPYVHVDEVVMKGTFCFVNTNDSIGAKRAREALNGAHLNGGPIRINIAQRKNRDLAHPSFSSNPVSAYGAAPGIPPNKGMRGDRGGGGPPPRTPQGQIDVDNIRDDRGNPATKNLFVAGYGPGTSETQVRQLFALHATIIGIIMKGTFSFVNTSEKIGAIQAREALSGTMLNGGVLRINFAKETGRLGTSFDLTYGGANPPPGGGGGGGSHSHYGR